MSKFRKKPIVIEAEQWFPLLVYGVLLNTPINPYVESGDWLVTEENGDVTICKPDIFEATYEVVDEREEQVNSFIRIPIENLDD